ncbi:MAG: glycosyltransferase family 4 protein [Verrucomicrobium sp.]|nr:glycosyltransferase family 4 protein [Verrucomicrobium sp.]
MPVPSALDLLFHVPSLHGNRIDEPGYCEENPLGGSETAVVRLAAALRQLGHRVRVETDPRALRGAACDALVCCRDWRPVMAEDISARLRYYWAQDDADQPILLPLKEKPELAAAFYRRCNGVALVSAYQFGRWVHELKLPPVLGPSGPAFLTANGVDGASVLPAEAVTPDRPRRAYYASTPFRGLDRLVESWPHIRAAVPDAELWIFGSRRVYKMDDTPEEAALYEQAAALPGVTCHGPVGQRALREAARQCRVLAYPCTFPETSCIAAMEAMAAGCAVVATHLGALPETAWRNPLVFPTEDWQAAWTFEVCRALADDTYYCDLAIQNVTTARSFGYGRLARQWDRRIRLDHALGQIPR